MTPTKKMISDDQNIARKGPNESKNIVNHSNRNSGKGASGKDLPSSLYDCARRPAPSRGDAFYRAWSLTSKKM